MNPSYHKIHYLQTRNKTEKKDCFGYLQMTDSDLWVIVDDFIRSQAGKAKDIETELITIAQVSQQEYSKNATNFKKTNS